MAELAGPIEFLDSRRAREWQFHPVRFEEGTTTIKSAESPAGKEISVLRVYVDPADKPHGPAYWDVSSKTLRPQLITILPVARARRALVTVRAQGFGVETRFSVEVAP